jgi:hypothetical protein
VSLVDALRRMEHTATPTVFYKSRLSWNSTRPGWDITFVDGTVYEIVPWGKLPGPPQVGAGTARATT